MKSTVFSANLSLKIPRNLTFFLRPIRGPVLWTVYVSSSWSGHLFLTLSPHFFPSRTPVMSNLDQSYFKRSERLYYIRNVKEWTKCLAFILTRQILFLTGHCPLTGRYYKPWCWCAKLVLWQLSSLLGTLGFTGGCRGCAPPPSWDDLRFSNTTVILQKKKLWGLVVLK